MVRSRHKSRRSYLKQKLPLWALYVKQIGIMVLYWFAYKACYGETLGKEGETLLPFAKKMSLSPLWKISVNSPCILLIHFNCANCRPCLAFLLWRKTLIVFLLTYTGSRQFNLSIIPVNLHSGVKSQVWSKVSNYRWEQVLITGGWF